MEAEIERNPLAVRQGAATVMCIAAAAVAMPVISDRAAAQRDGAEWAARSISYQATLNQHLVNAEPSARVELTAFRAGDGLRARGTASLFGGGDTHAMLVEAALRGPLAPGADGPVAPLAPQQINAREHACMARAIYYESRGESRDGQVAVGEVVMNRVRSSAYPNSVCAVVYQGSHRATGCQFSFTCDGSLNRRPRGVAWVRAQEVATQVMGGFTRPLTRRATHYHTNAINPVWSSGLVETTRIGSHIFYRFPNRAERPVYQAALAQRLASRPRTLGAVLAEEDAVAAELAPELEVIAESAEIVADAPMEAAPEPVEALPDAAIETVVDEAPLAEGEVAT